MRMTGIKTGVGLPHNIGHSNAWKNYSVNEVNEYKSRQYGSKGNKYRFSVSGNLLIYEPNKGRLFPIAKIRRSSFDDGVDRYYLEWLPSSKKLSKKERENAEHIESLLGTKQILTTIADAIITPYKLCEANKDLEEDCKKYQLHYVKQQKKRMEDIKNNMKKQRITKK